MFLQRLDLLGNNHLEKGETGIETGVIEEE